MEKEKIDDRKKAVINLGKDSSILTIGLLKTDPEKLNFDIVIKHIEFLKKQAEKIGDAYYPKSDTIAPEKLEDIQFNADQLTK